MNPYRSVVGSPRGVAVPPTLTPVWAPEPEAGDGLRAAWGQLVQPRGSGRKPGSPGGSYRKGHNVKRQTKRWMMAHPDPDRGLRFYRDCLLFLVGVVVILALCLKDWSPS